MHVLVTGASSFSGYWFIKKLVERGHAVTAVLRGHPNGYSGVRALRVNEIVRISNAHGNLVFGDEAFVQLLDNVGRIDLYCHHAAETSNYRSEEFDVLGAVAANIRNLDRVLQQLVKAGCNRLIYSGSVFEADEGIGDPPLRAFSPYGLSKAITGQLMQQRAARFGLVFGKFVIANPFGPLEEYRFASYLAKSWLEGKPAIVNAPRYVRDNIPVDLLAECYSRFAEAVPIVDSAPLRSAPSFYVDTNAGFALRLQHEIRNRLGVECRLELREQLDFPEPAVRLNPQPIDTRLFRWRETEFWNQLVEYYAKSFGGGIRH